MMNTTIILVVIAIDFAYYEFNEDVFFRLHEQSVTAATNYIKSL